MSSEMIKVQFHDDTLDACGTTPENAEVSIRRVCENLGVSTEGQLKKLKAKAWAVMNQKFMTGPDDKLYEVATIALKSLPMWLATIEARKVKEHLREKLARYQQECHDVLARHFLTKSKSPSVNLSMEQFERLVGRVEHLQQQLDRLNVIPPAIAPPTPALPRFTVQQRLEWKGWPEAGRDARKRIRRLAVARIDANFGETPDQAGGPGGGGPLRFYAAQLVYLDQAIDEVREAVLRRERENAAPHLFSDRPAA
jgi:hypothetical protein